MLFFPLFTKYFQVILLTLLLETQEFCNKNKIKAPHKVKKPGSMIIQRSLQKSIAEITAKYIINKYKIIYLQCIIKMDIVKKVLPSFLHPDRLMNYTYNLITDVPRLITFFGLGVS